MTNEKMSPRAENFLPWLQVIFIACLIVANIIAVKIVQIFGLVLPAAVVVFPLSYIVGDILTEIYGFRIAKKTILMGFLANFLVVVFIWLGGLLPAAPFWQNSEAYTTILGFSLRLLIASFIAYLAGELLNASVMVLLKKVTKGKYLFIRTIGSTLVGQGIDSILFLTIAFVGTESGAMLGTLILTQWIFKCAYEAIATPLTYGAVIWLKKEK